MKVYKSLLELEKVCPELFFIMRNCRIDPVEKRPKMTAFAARTKTGFKIGINSDWIDNFDTWNLSGIIEHELLHIVMNHCCDIEAMPDRKLANIAQDYIINDLSHFLKDRSRLNDDLKKGCYLEKLNDQHGTKFNSHSNTIKEIYDFLVNLKEKQKDKLEQFDGGLDKGEDDSDVDPNDAELDEDMIEALSIAAATMGMKIDDNQDGNEEEDKNQGSMKSEMGLDSILSPDEMKEIMKSYGRKSADMAQYLGKIEKKERNRKIKNAIDKFFSSNKSEHKKTIKKRNKRFSFVPYGRQKDTKQKVLLGLDVSGSMLDPETIAKLKMSVDSATSNGYTVDLIFGDTEKLGEFKDIKASFDFEKVFGGGGTDLAFIFKEKIEDYDCVIVVTDGYFDHDDIPKSRKNSILFLNTTTKEIPNFKNLYI